MYPKFFSVEEVFLRLGQNRFKGCLIVLNKHESAHIFVNEGVVVCALADKLFGEAALTHALHLEDSSCSWLAGAEPVINNLQLAIQEYAMKHAIARDTRVGQTITLPKQATKVLSKEELAHRFPKKELHLDFVYYFTDEVHPAVKMKLSKLTNVAGRDETCDFILHNPEVSRRHCILQVTERGIMIKDLESTNGTFINGIQMTDGYINRGDRLSFGTYELTLHVEKNLGPKVD